jgi:hypothetical protein
MKKILLISYYFYPVNTPHSQKWTELLSHISDNNYQIDVLCSRGFGQNEYENFNGIEIYRVSGGSLHNKRHLINNVDYKSSKRNTIKKVIYKFLKKTHDLTWKKIYWPDFSVLWYREAIKKAERLMKENNYDEVISVSFPFTPHLIAYKLKKKFNFKWHMEVGDPFYFSDQNPFNNKIIYNKLNYYLDKKTMHAADKIYLYKEAKEAYLNAFPLIKSKVTEIPICYFDKKNKHTPVLIDNNKDYKELLFIGTLNKRIRNPKFLLDCLVIFKKEQSDLNFRMHFVGHTSDCLGILKKYQKLLGDSIKITPPVSKNQVISYINSADVLVNIGNDSKFQLPSKLIEYISTGKVILNFANDRKDTSAEFLKKYKNTVNIFRKHSTKNEIIEGIKTAMQLKDITDEEYIENLIMPHRIENIIKLYDLL